MAGDPGLRAQLRLDDRLEPVAQLLRRARFIFGTIITSFIALLLATPLSIAIALFLTEIAPRRLRGPIATVVELLAAIPSVVLGLWGILVFGPWLRGRTSSRGFRRWFGFLPIFSGDPVAGRAAARGAGPHDHDRPDHLGICRELFSRIPRDLTDGALALGSTRWEAIRGVVLPYAAPGIVAAMLLGLGRAFGEAIAVTQVIGAGPPSRPRSSPPATRSRAGSRRSTRARSRACRSTRSSTSPRS